jgi:tripartite-type tricarboxylate transporter receptor subunit TctC
MSGQTDLALVDLPASLQQIRAGKLIAYAVTGPTRSQQLPDTPTLSEAGLRGYDSTGWFGVVAPAGTPAPAIRRLNAAITEALGDPTIQANMRNLGVEPVHGTPESFSAYIASETTKWSQVIKQGNIKIEQ